MQWASSTASKLMGMPGKYSLNNEVCSLSGDTNRNLKFPLDAFSSVFFTSKKLKPLCITKVEILRLMSCLA